MCGFAVKYSQTSVQHDFSPCTRNHIAFLDVLEFWKCPPNYLKNYSTVIPIYEIMTQSMQRCFYSHLNYNKYNAKTKRRPDLGKVASEGIRIAVIWIGQHCLFFYKENVSVDVHRLESKIAFLTILLHFCFIFTSVLFFFFRGQIPWPPHSFDF